MKKSRKSLFALILSICMISLLFTACAKEEENEEVDNDTDYVAIVSFESDSDNEIEWVLRQEEHLFSVEEMFMEDDGYEGEGSGEEQFFYLYPSVAGSTILHFSCEMEGVVTTYDYDVTVTDTFHIEVNSSSGTRGDEEVAAPTMMIDLNY